MQLHSLPTTRVLQGATYQMQTLNLGFSTSSASALLSGCAVNKGAEATTKPEPPFLPSSLAGRRPPALCTAGYSHRGAC